MPEHVHLLIRPRLPEMPVAEALRRIKGPFAVEVSRRWRAKQARVLKRVTIPSGRVRFWQPGGGYDRNIWSPEEVIEKINYIHRNPVKRGLCERATDYPWSSARWYAGMREDGLRMDVPFLFRGQPPEDVIRQVREMDEANRQWRREREAR